LSLCEIIASSTERAVHLHARRDRDEQRHDADLAFADTLGEHDGNAWLAVDAAAPECHFAVHAGRDRLKSAHVAGRDVGCVHGVFSLLMGCISAADARPRAVASGRRGSPLPPRKMAIKRGRREVFCPIAGWTKIDVISYLGKRGIPIPSSSATTTCAHASGISLVPHELFWLYDEHPDDFKTLCQYFPYAEAVIWRRKFYGEAKQAGRAA
jgi:hypothetical protein